MPSGIWLVHLGVGSDTVEADLDHVCREIEVLAQARPNHVQLLHEDRVVHLSILVAAELPKIQPLRSALLWVFNHRALAAWTHSPMLYVPLTREYLRAHGF